MGRKNVLQPYQVISGASLVGSTTSLVTNVQQLDRVAYDVVWAGSGGVTGTLFVDAQVAPVLGTWTPLDIDPMPVATDSGNHMITIETADFVNIRLRYVGSTGTGLISAYISGSGVA